MEEGIPIVKRIPLNHVIIPKEPVRKSVKSSRIKMFEENYKEGNPIAPIKVIPIQSGDPKNIDYLLTAGLHRYGAMIGLDYKETEAQIDTTTVLTHDDLDNNETRIIIDSAQIQDNARGSLQHTDEEIREFVRKNYIRGADVEYLAGKTGYAARTIHRWIADLLDENKREQRQKVIRQHALGKDVHEIAKEVGITRSTAYQWIKEATKNHNGKKEDKQAKTDLKETKDTSPSDIPKNDTCQKSDKTGQETHSPETSIKVPATAQSPDAQPLPETALKHSQQPHDPDRHYADEMQDYSTHMNDYQRLQAAAIFLKSLTPSPEMENEILKYILPLIASHFPNLQEENIKNIDYAYKAEQLMDSLTNQKNRAMALNRLLTEAKKTIATLEDELKKRKNTCNMTCPYTMERMEHEEEKNIKNTVDEIRELSLVLSGHITKMKEKQVTPLQRKLHAYMHSEHQEPAKDITKQLILNRAFSLASQLEACTHEAMLTDKVEKYLEDAKSRLSGIGIKPAKHSRNGKKNPTPSRALSDTDAYRNLYIRFDEIKKKREYIAQKKTITAKKQAQ